MANLYIYTTPKEASVQLTLDSGIVLMGGPPHTANGREDAHLLLVPDGTPSQGSVLSVRAEGYYDFHMRGITSATPQFILDDVKLTAKEAAPTPPDPGPTPPSKPTDPEGLIHWVYNQGGHNLSTKEGCGQFTEACCTELHNSCSEMWGHIAKYGAQNQWNGHAVDAIQLLAGQGTGIYDIIHDSESPNASPAYNYKGPADPSLWYYPAADVGGYVLAPVREEQFRRR